MSIPSHRIEGTGSSRKVTVTFYGQRMPDSFYAGGIKYRAERSHRLDAVREDDMLRLRCQIRGESVVIADRPEFCPICGAVVL